MLNEIRLARKPKKSTALVNKLNPEQDPSPITRFSKKQTGLSPSNFRDQFPHLFIKKVG